MTKRKMLSPNQQAEIKAKLTDIGKRLRKWSYPAKAPNHEIGAILAELDAIINLNMVEGYGPVTLFDRAATLERRAQIIRSREAPPASWQG
jgi:hypothetical protein